MPQVVAMKWWSRQKGVPGKPRQQQQAKLRQVAQPGGASCATSLIAANEPVQTTEQARDIVFSYVRSFQNTVRLLKMLCLSCYT